MAPTFAKQVSCLLFFVALFVSCHIEARESKFFSKQIHLTIPKKDVTIPSTASPAPSPAPVINYISNAPTPTDQYAYAPSPLNSDLSPSPAPTADYISNAAPTPAEYAYAPAPHDDSQLAPSAAESEDSYYGLYGKGTNSFLADMDTSLDVGKADEFSDREAEALNYSEPNTNYVDVDSYSGKLNKQNTFSNWNEESRYYNSNNNFENSEPQGMSDTRLLENGKYYYNVEQENYVPNVQEMSRENNNLEGEYFGNYQGKSKFEFDTMEEYEKQEGYPDFQQEFIP